MKARERVGCVGPLACRIGRDETIEHQGGSVIFASVHGNVQRRANPKSNRSVWLTTDPAAEDVHQRSRLNGAKLTGVEELAIADRTRLVRHVTAKSIQSASEQLRALEAGMTIAVARVDSVPLSVDTPADLEKARKALSRS